MADDEILIWTMGQAKVCSDMCLWCGGTCGGKLGQNHPGKQSLGTRHQFWDFQTSLAPGTLNPAPSEASPKSCLCCLNSQQNFNHTKIKIKIKSLSLIGRGPPRVQLKKPEALGES